MQFHTFCRGLQEGGWSGCTSMGCYWEIMDLWNVGSGGRSLGHRYHNLRRDYVGPCLALCFCFSLRKKTWAPTCTPVRICYCHQWPKLHDHLILDGYTKNCEPKPNLSILQITCLYHPVIVMTHKVPYHKILLSAAFAIGRVLTTIQMLSLVLTPG